MLKLVLEARDYNAATPQHAIAQTEFADEKRQ
jgi:hypothetical protein